MEDKELIDRIKRIIDLNSVSPTEFANKIGFNQSNLSKILKGDRKVPSNLLTKISKELNIELLWLQCGKGNMIIGETKNDINHKPIKNLNAGVPYYNMDFELGFDAMENDQTCNPEFLINYLPYNGKATCWCNATGLSMYPTIESGDIIALKEIEDFSVLLNDKIYAIVTTNDLRTIKRVEDNGDTIILKPDNKEFIPQTISKDKLRKVFLVVGSIKKF